MSWFTRSTPIETIKDAVVFHVEDVERNDGSVQRDRGFEIRTETGKFAGSADTLEEARERIGAWDRYPDPAKQMASFNVAASHYEGSEMDDGTGFNF